jgi:hypothetical protein
MKYTACAGYAENAFMYVKFTEQGCKKQQCHIQLISSILTTLADGELTL